MPPLLRGHEPGDLGAHGLVAPSKLVLTLPDGQVQEFEMDSGMTIGRAASSDIVVTDGLTSRRHAQIVVSSRGGYEIVDLASRNGTRVNGSRVQRATLRTGDVITIGEASLQVEVAEPEVQVKSLQLTSLQLPGDIDATLLESPLATFYTDTHVSRLAIFTPERTWEVPLSAGPVGIGRRPGSDIELPYEEVSRDHAVIEPRSTMFAIRDLGSRNGTWYREDRIEERTLADGDAVRIGPARLIFKQGFDGEELDEPIPRSTRRPVVIVPGLMGSELWRGSDRVWPNVRRFLTDPEVVQFGGRYELEPRAILNDVVVVPGLIRLAQYGRLRQFLEESLGYERPTDLLEFPYDFRQDIRISARQLAQRSATGRRTALSPSSPTAWAAWFRGTTSSAWAARLALIVWS